MLSRRLRISSGDYAYHVLNRDAARTRVFGRQCDFEETIAQAKPGVSMRVLAWYALPNHEHSILWPRGEGDLSEFMRWLTVTHTQRWHAAHRTAGTGPLYQGRFKLLPIQENDHLLTLLRHAARKTSHARVFFPVCPPLRRVLRQTPRTVAA